MFFLNLSWFNTNCNKNYFGELKMKDIETHTHHLHEESVEALREVAKAMNITYSAVKQRFTIEQDLRRNKVILGEIL